jgi:cell filamentation protein, protein adenylyltransferase
MSDPYVYPGTNVLRNKEDIRDAEELEAFERLATANRMETLPDSVPITAEGYCAIHRYLFQDVYDWAGQYRLVDIARTDDLFCLAPYIERELAKRFAAIQSENSLRGLSPEQFAARAADHMTELNAIHPFREGNGRTQRAFLFVLGRQAGHDIAMERIDARAWNEASRDSFRTGNPRAMHDVIAAAIYQQQADSDPA